MESKMVRFPLENERFQVCKSSGDPAHSQKMDLEWASVWRAKCQEFHWGNEGFQASVGLEHSANSQKMDLEWASVWRAKCKELLRKMTEFGGQWG